MGTNGPSRDQTCSWHVIGHFIQNTMLQIGVQRSSPLEEGGVEQKKEWTNWLQSWKDKPFINRLVGAMENMFSCWRFGFLQPINAWDPQLKWEYWLISDGKMFGCERNHLDYLQNLERKMRILLFSFSEEEGAVMSCIPWAHLHWAEPPQTPFLCPKALLTSGENSRARLQRICQPGFIFCS